MTRSLRDLTQSPGRDLLLELIGGDCEGGVDFDNVGPVLTYVLKLAEVIARLRRVEDAIDGDTISAAIEVSCHQPCTIPTTELVPGRFYVDSAGCKRLALIASSDIYPAPMVNQTDSSFQITKMAVVAKFREATIQSWDEEK